MILSENMLEIIEIVSVVTSLLFVLLIINSKKSGWWFGIISSFLSIVLFFNVNLYLEALLYFFYFAMGFYGLNQWSKIEKVPIVLPGLKRHLFHIVILLLVSLLIGYIFKKYTNASIPYIDSISTVFGIYATWLEAKRYLSAWFFWIVLNIISIGIYAYKELLLYALLMVIYTILSIVGYTKWRREMLNYTSKTSQ